MDQTSLDQLSINTIRMLSVDAVEKAKSGHPGTPMGDAVMAYVLWTRFMHYNPKNPFWQNRDRFVLSEGHASMLLYSLLYLTGYDLSLEDIRNFRQWESKTPGHPEYGFAPGVETTTGPLGQGFGNGVGMAIAERYLEKLFNKPDEKLVDYYIYAFCSDGDMMEGVSHEAASLAGHLALNKLICFYSDNRITIEGHTDLAFSEDVGKRFEAYKWFVQRVDGNDMEQVANAIVNAQSQTEQPSLIIARTHIGYGSPKQDSAEAHGEPLGPDAVKAAREFFHWPQEPTFYIPEAVLSSMRQAVDRGESMEREWREQFDRYAVKYPEMAELWKMIHENRFPADWDRDIPVFAPENGKMATRDASGAVINAIGSKLPQLIGGSADLAPSTKTLLKGAGDFEAHEAGRNLHFGVREHAMGTILSGIALSKALIPYGATFLIFYDYMRPPVRLAAMMGLRVIYVYTHDSIGLGEDGPTHQPIEQLAGLRAIPNMTTIRPADANETAEAWRMALEHPNGPTALILTRQKLPIIDRTRYASVEGVRRGAYILADADAGKPELILIATGSEVHPTLEAYEQLKKEGIRVRLVNMPSWEVFEQQPRDYRDEVLPPDITARLAVEAASPLGWERWIGLHGKMVGMTRFGSSAPGDVNMRNFGFTPENIVRHARALLGQSVVGA